MKSFVGFNVDDDVYLVVFHQLVDGGYFIAVLGVDVQLVIFFIGCGIGGDDFVFVNGEGVWDGLVRNQGREAFGNGSDEGLGGVFGVDPGVDTEAAVREGFDGVEVGTQGCFEAPECEVKVPDEIWTAFDDFGFDIEAGG